MAKTTADVWFERYLLDHGYGPGEHEQDLTHLGVAKRPDFWPRLGAEQVICEVKQFGENDLQRRLARQRFLTTDDKMFYKPVRNQVREAAKTLKPLTPQGLPLVIVLANPAGAYIDLSTRQVIAALSGSPRFVFTVSGETGGSIGDERWEAANDGRLTHFHPYISAVALLRRRERDQDEIDRLADEFRQRHPEPETREERVAYTAGLLDVFEDRRHMEGDYFWVDVIETESETATPLQDHWFRGPRDTRWRLNDRWEYEQA